MGNSTSRNQNGPIRRIRRSSEQIPDDLRQRNRDAAEARERARNQREELVVEEPEAPPAVPPPPPPRQPHPPSLQRQATPYVAIASCPICAKYSRPRALNVNALDCVSRHISAKARQGEPLHSNLHRALHADPATGRPKCPGCNQTFDNRLELFSHLASATDAAHAACRADADTIARNTAGNQGAAYGAERSNAPRAGTAAALADVAALYARQENAEALAEEERQRLAADEAAQREVQAEAAAAASLYAAAKMGGERGASWVSVHLFERGVDPNEQRDDGFTPLMTASEAGHADVVRILRTHPGLRANLKNACAPPPPPRAPGQPSSMLLRAR